MGRNWTRRSIEELIDEYLDRYGKIIKKSGGIQPTPVTGGLGAIHYSNKSANFFNADFFNVANVDSQGSSYQQNIKPLKVPIDSTGVDTLDTNFGLSYPSSEYSIGRFSRSGIIYEYNRTQKRFSKYDYVDNNSYFTYSRWFYYDSTDNIIYRLKNSTSEVNPFPSSVLVGGYIFQTRGEYITPPSDVDVMYVEYAVVNVGQLYNMVNVQDIANLNDGYLIGTTIHLEDDFIKKYVQWFISSGTLPSAVQDLIIS